MTGAYAERVVVICCVIAGIVLRCGEMLCYFACCHEGNKFLVPCSDQAPGGQSMSDEKAIRDLFTNWIKATTDGNLSLAHQCIANNAVFLVPGVGEMDKNSFAEAAAGGSPEESPIQYDLDSKLRDFSG